MSDTFNVLNNFYVYISPWDLMNNLFSCLCSKVTVFMWKWQWFLVTCSRFPCELCNKTYQNKPYHTRHGKSEHLENLSRSKDRYLCGFCDKTYKTNCDLTRHNNMEHEILLERKTDFLVKMITWNMKIHLDQKTDFLVKFATKPTKTSLTLQDMKSLNM